MKILLRVWRFFFPLPPPVIREPLPIPAKKQWLHAMILTGYLEQ